MTAIKGDLSSISGIAEFPIIGVGLYDATVPNAELMRWSSVSPAVVAAQVVSVVTIGDSEWSTTGIAGVTRYLEPRQRHQALPGSDELREWVGADALGHDHRGHRVGEPVGRLAE